MKLLRSVVATTAIIVSQTLSAQTVDVINAEPTGSYLWLTLQPPGKDGKSSFKYALDGHKNEDETAPMPASLTLAGRRSRGVNVVLAFLNPILYSWTVSETTSDDPTYVAVRQFLTSANSLFGVIGLDPSKKTPQSGGGAPAILDQTNPGPGRVSQMTTPRQRADSAIKDTTRANQRYALITDFARVKISEKTFKWDSVGTDSVVIPALYSPALRDWSQWLSERSKCFVDVTDARTLISSISAADHQLYGPGALEPDGTRTAESFRDALLGALQLMRDADRIDSLRQANKRVSDTLSKLAAANKTAAAALSAVKPPRVWGREPGCTNFRNYTQVAIKALQSDGTKLVDAREKVLADFTALRDRVSELLAVKRAVANGDPEFFTIANVSIPPGKMKEVTVTVHRRTVELKDGAIQTTESADSRTSFHVVERQSILFEFAPGAAYMNIHHPQFGTDTSNGKIVVGAAGDDTQNGAIVGMLNIIPNNMTGALSRLIGQIGVGSGKPYPLLMFGGGIRLSDSSAFTLSIGAAFGWRKELTRLKIGDSVSGTADIEKDLAYHLHSKPQFYIGMQRGLQ